MVVSVIGYVCSFLNQNKDGAAGKYGTLLGQMSEVN
jgi:hypothetical protein